MRIRAPLALARRFSSLASEYEVVVGLEFHVQVACSRKLFSPAPAGSHSLPPNAAVEPFDLAMPGTLPQLNPEAVEAAVRLGCALGGEVQRSSFFERKHYTYPDLPHGYQITQHKSPIVRGGALWLLPEEEEEGTAPLRLSVEQVQLEMDTAKSSRGGVGSGVGGQQLDFNRAGCALLEVVTAPELRSGKQAAAAVRALQRLLRHTRVSAAQLEDGSLRCDVNVSLRPLAAGGAPGGRVEVKNLNSTRSVQRAIAFEAERHAELLRAGLPVPRQTLTFDVASGRTVAMRDKESALDYRFLPEPDLPHVIVDEEMLERVRASVPELPDAARARLQLQEGLASAHAALLSADPETLAYFDATLRALRAAPLAQPAETARLTCNWVLGDALRSARAARLPSLAAHPPAAAPDRLALLLRLVLEGVVSGPQAKAALGSAFAGEAGPLDQLAAEAAAATGAGASAAGVERDEETLRALCAEVLAEHPKQAEAWRGGRDRMMGLFVGQALKRTAGRADPVLATRLFTELLKSSGS